MRLPCNRPRGWRLLGRLPLAVGRMCDDGPQAHGGTRYCNRNVDFPRCWRTNPSATQCVDPPRPTIAETALAECGDHASVAIVDRTGRLKVFLQGDNAAPHNIELARRKAYTSQTFGRTSLEWAQRTESSNISGQRMLTDVITQQGGVPIKFGDETIGGVGLSGAPNGGQQEEACAKAGIAKVADQLKP
jgi:uncharacterized protein GlcG (DUF336 family)